MKQITGNVKSLKLIGFWLNKQSIADKFDYIKKHTTLLESNINTLNVYIKNNDLKSIERVRKTIELQKSFIKNATESLQRIASPTKIIPCPWDIQELKLVVDYLGKENFYLDNNNIDFECEICDLRTSSDFLCSDNFFIWNYHYAHYVQIHKFGIPDVMINKIKKRIKLKSFHRNFSLDNFYVNSNIWENWTEKKGTVAVMTDME
jgi:hypothetical protein